MLLVHGVILPIWRCAKKNFYTRRIVLWKNERKEIFDFSYYPLPKQHKGYIIITVPSEKVHNEIHHLESKYALNEVFLYSMNVNLETGQCFNTYVTEVLLAGQDMPVLSYQEWRDMLIKAFSAEDRSFFLDRTDPGYIKARLKSVHESISFDIRMHTISHSFIWTRHTIYRIMNYSSSDLMILYTVQNINEEKTVILEEIRKLEDNLLYDSLTHTYNTETMKDLVLEACEKVAQSHPYSIIYVSLKPSAVNNTVFYHTQNDEIIIKLASFLKANLPEEIIIAHSRFAAFVCMCPDTDISMAEKIGKALLEKHRQTRSDSGSDIYLGIGVMPILPQENLDQVRQKLDRIGMAVMQPEGDTFLSGTKLAVTVHKERNSDIILSKVEQEVRLHFSEKLTLKSLADKYYINSAYLGQLFIQHYGVSFSDYLWSERLERAASLLAGTNKYIYEILNEVGISNANYFKKMFTRQYGMSPSQYRKKMQE